MKKVQCEVYSRVVGYYRPVDQWNRGKQEEFENRSHLKIASFENKCDCEEIHGEVLHV